MNRNNILNAKERVLKTLEHEKPDRVPLFELGIIIYI